MKHVNWFGYQGPVSRKSREIFGPKKVVAKLQSACFEKLTFLHVFNIRKSKRIAKFDGLEPRRYEDIKGIVTPEIDPKSFGTFEKRAPGSFVANNYAKWISIHVQYCDIIRFRVLHNRHHKVSQSVPFFMHCKTVTISLRIGVRGHSVMSITNNHESHYVAVSDNPPSYSDFRQNENGRQRL